MQVPHITNLTVQTVQSTLDAMRRATPLGRQHPMAEFVSMGLPPMGDTYGTYEVTVFEYLGRLIEQQLAELRQQCVTGWGTSGHLPPVSLAALQQDFHVGNAELEAWSLLYHRYVRVDLDLSVKDMADLVGQPTRTLNRRQHHGMGRLLHVLVQREAQARKERHQTVLRSQLPAPAPAKLLGREAALRWAIAYLSRDMPSHLCVQGVAGVGKSVFALTVALHLIQMNAIDGLVWLESPPTKPHELKIQIAHQLNFADLTPDANLEITLHSGRVLIVLDQADAWLNRAFLATQPWLRSARLMLISSVKAQVPVHMGYVNLPPLDREAALQAMLAEFHIPDEQLERFVSLFNAAFDDAQGNLKLLRKIIVEATRAQDDGHWLSPRLAGQDNSVITRKNLGKRLQTILTIFATGSWKRSIVSPSK